MHTTKRRLQGCVMLAALGAFVAAEPNALADTASDQGLTLEIKPGEKSADTLSQMSLEDLMNVEVTSVSRYRQHVSNAPAAITVITQEEIARSNLHSIPELLRLSPGMTVQRIDASHWAISSRGFSEKYANKLLVLMDGRTLYTPVNSGVTWDQQDYILADLERIEVIRGPGATMWGANAVNGVVNITTKSAQDTQGLLVTGLTGNIDNAGGVRYGGKLDDETYYRLYTTFRKNEDFVDPSGDSRFDGWQSTRGGFRLDRYGSPQDTLTLQGEVSQNLFGERAVLPSVTPPFTETTQQTQYSGGEFILGRWTHQNSFDSEFSVQLYYDRVFHEESSLGYAQDTYDLDFQHHFQLGNRQQIVWGAGARFLSDSKRISEINHFDPKNRDDYRFNAFVQDDIAIVPERFHVILGSKLEYTSYCDLDYEPSARVLWTPNNKNTVWGAVSSAVHTPTPVEQDGRFLAMGFEADGGVPAAVYVDSNPDYKAETLTAYELGYRLRPRENLSLDVATFYNRYERLRTVEPGTQQLVPTPTPSLVINNRFANGMDAESYGVETSVNFKLSPEWVVSSSYSFIAIEAHRRAGSLDTGTEFQIEHSDPRNQVQVHTSYELTRGLRADASAYYVEHIGDGEIPSMVRVDLGLTYQPKKDLSISIGVQNLLDDRHPEAGPGVFATPAEFPRTVYAQLSLQF